MTSTLTPPPSSPAPAGPDSPQPDRTAARVVAILTVALGVAVIVATVWAGVVPTVRAASTRSETQSVPVSAGIDTLAVDVDAASLVIRFDDVSVASLDVRNVGAGSWTLERDGGVLRVETPRAPFLSWFGGGNGRATLTLPRSLDGVDADLLIDAGSLDADGVFGDLRVELGAGDATVSGEADALVLEASAGSAEFDLDGVAEAELGIGAGEITGRLAGETPHLVTVSVSAGSLDVTLPDGSYDVSADVSAGDFSHELREDPSSDSRIVVEVSAGSAMLRAG